MNVANYLSYNKQNASVRAKFTLFWYRLVIYAVLVQCAICLKFLSSFPCSSEIFLNFKLLIIWLLINWFLIKKTCVYVSPILC